MEKINGWTGSLGRIELPSGELTMVSSMDYAEDFIGGRLLGSRLYWDEIPVKTKALDPDNVLMFCPALSPEPRQSGAPVGLLPPSHPIPSRISTVLVMVGDFSAQL